MAWLFIGTPFKNVFDSKLQTFCNEIWCIGGEFVSLVWKASFIYMQNEFRKQIHQNNQVIPKKQQHIFSPLLHHIFASPAFSSRLPSVFPCHLTAEQSLTKQQGCYGNITLPLMTSRLRWNKYGCQLGCKSVYLQIFIKVIQTEGKTLIFIDAYLSKHSVSSVQVISAFCEVNPQFLHH